MRVMAMVFAVSAWPAAAAAASGFDGLDCGSDIAAALVGRAMPNGPVVETEARYAGLQLQALGAFGMEVDGDPWTLGGWMICGTEYLVLEKAATVRDVLPSPTGPGGARSELVSCRRDGEALAATAVAFPTSQPVDWSKPLAQVWLIDDAAVAFRKLEGAGIVCAP